MINAIAKAKLSRDPRPKLSQKKAANMVRLIILILIKRSL